MNRIQLTPLPNVPSSYYSHDFVIKEGFINPTLEVTSLELLRHGLLVIIGCSNGMILCFHIYEDGNEDGYLIGHIQAKGMQTKLIMTVKGSEDGRFCFAGVIKGSSEMLAIDLGMIPLHKIETSEEQRIAKKRKSENSSEKYVKPISIDQMVLVYRHSDAKLRGFGDVILLNNEANKDAAEYTGIPIYRLACGKGIKNIHVWQFTPDHLVLPNLRANSDQIYEFPNSEVSSAQRWACIYDVASNGNTITHLGFRDDGLELLSKSANANLRVWNLAQYPPTKSENIDGQTLTPPIQASTMFSKPTYYDVPNSADVKCLLPFGNLAYGGTFEFAVVKTDQDIVSEASSLGTTANKVDESDKCNLKDVNRDLYELPEKASGLSANKSAVNADESYRRRRAFREIDDIISTDDGANAIVFCTDGTCMYFHNSFFTQKTLASSNAWNLPPSFVADKTSCDKTNEISPSFTDSENSFNTNNSTRTNESVRAIESKPALVTPISSIRQSKSTRNPQEPKSSCETFASSLTDSCDSNTPDNSLKIDERLAADSAINSRPYLIELDGIKNDEESNSTWNLKCVGRHNHVVILRASRRPLNLSKRDNKVYSLVVCLQLLNEPKKKDQSNHRSKPNSSVKLPSHYYYDKISHHRSMEAISNGSQSKPLADSHQEPTLDSIDSETNLKTVKMKEKFKTQKKVRPFRLEAQKCISIEKGPDPIFKKSSDSVESLDIVEQSIDRLINHSNVSESPSPTHHGKMIHTSAKVKFDTEPPQPTLHFQSSTIGKEFIATEVSTIRTGKAEYDSRLSISSIECLASIYSNPRIVPPILIEKRKIIPIQRDWKRSFDNASQLWNQTLESMVGNCHENIIQLVRKEYSVQTISYAGKKAGLAGKTTCILQIIAEDMRIIRMYFEELKNTLKIKLFPYKEVASMDYSILLSIAREDIPACITSFEIRLNEILCRRQQDWSGANRYDQILQSHSNYLKVCPSQFSAAKLPSLYDRIDDTLLQRLVSDAEMKLNAWIFNGHRVWHGNNLCREWLLANSISYLFAIVKELWKIDSTNP